MAKSSIIKSSFKHGERIINIYQKDSVGININIETWADVDKVTWMCWGDYWVKENLLKSFRELGATCEVSPEDADATIYLWGSKFPQRKNWPFGYNPKSVNILWLYSHPDNMNEIELSRYNMVFTLSKSYVSFLRKLGSRISIMPDPLLSCSSFNPPAVDTNYQSDITFVGNARGALTYGREAVYWLDPPVNTKVNIYGAKWEIPKFNTLVYKYLKDRYYPYERLNQLYHNSKINLIDGHQDMCRWGFVPMKLFDVLSSRGFPLMMYNNGVKEIFGDSVVMYSSKGEMNAKINYYLKNDAERLKLIDEGYNIAIKHRFMHRAKTLLEKIRMRCIK